MILDARIPRGTQDHRPEANQILQSGTPSLLPRRPAAHGNHPGLLPRGQRHNSPRGRVSNSWGSLQIPFTADAVSRATKQSSSCTARAPSSARNGPWAAVSHAAGRDTCAERVSPCAGHAPRGTGPSRCDVTGGCRLGRGRGTRSIASERASPPVHARRVVRSALCAVPCDRGPNTGAPWRA